MKQYDFEFTLVTGEKVVHTLETECEVEDGHDVLIMLDEITYCGKYVTHNGIINPEHVVSVTYEEAL